MGFLNTPHWPMFRHPVSRPSSLAPPFFSLLIIGSVPLDLRLVVHAQDEVGEQLEDVLPHQQETVEVEIADVNLAALAGEADLTNTVESVDEVAAVSAVQARARRTLVQLQLTPMHKWDSSNEDFPQC